MEDLIWQELKNGESDVDAEPINKLAEYVKKLNINKADKRDMVIDSELSSESSNPVQNKTVKEALNNYANALEGSESGTNICVEDVSCVEHNVSVQVRSYNALNLGNIAETTQKGITYSIEDNVLKIDGTASNSVGIYINIDALCNGTTYTHSVRCNGSSPKIYFSVNNLNENTLLINTTDDLKSKSFIPDYESFRYQIWIDKGSVFDNCEYYLQIERGTKVTDFIPYVDVSTVNVKTLGKNLFKPTALSTEMNGVTLTLNEDNSYTLNGTTTETVYIWLGGIPANDDFTYYVSGGVSSDVRLACQLRIDTTNINTVYSVGDVQALNLSQTSNKPYNNFNLIVVIKAGVTLSNVIVKPMISFSSNPSYEPYIEPASYPVETDGTVDGVTSISPTMTITTDTEGVYVDLKYNRDTNKVIEKLVDAIVSLGGNV